MNGLGISLATAAVQVTLAAVPAVVLVAWAGRRSPRAAAALAAVALGLCFLLTAAALGPLPGWWSWNSSIGVQSPDSPTPSLSGDDSAARPSDTGGWRPTLRRLTDLLPAVAPTAIEVPAWSAWALLAGLFVVGLAVEALRLLAGLAAVAVCRYRSRPIKDTGLTRLADDLRSALGVMRPIELRVSEAVGTAATVGWWRPVVLLAADWPTWDESELRTVVAHELAHVRRGDYLAGLFAIACRALHFYHPLVRWLVGRLRLQQELAADALAAAVAGGRTGYLRALARVALRQDERFTAWAARPFLSDRGTLLRRVAMLRVTDDGRPLGRTVGWGLAGLLVAAAVGASAVRGTAQGPAGVDPPVADELPPFDLSFVPPKADGVVLIRPAALLARPEMKAVTECWNRALAEWLREWGFGPDFALSLGEIEQAVGPFELKTLTDEERKQHPNGEGHAIMMGLAAIRVTPGFDWPAKLKALPPAMGLKEVTPGVYEIRATKLGPNPLTLHVPDPRTLVFNLPGQTAAGPGDPAARWGAAGKHVERAGFAVLLDNRRGQWTESVTSDPAAAALKAVLGKPTHLTYGLTWGERVGVTAAVEYAEAPAGADVERGATVLRQLVGSALAGHKPADTTDQWLHDLVSELLRTAAVRQEGKLVAMDATSARRWVDVLSVIPVDGPPKGKVSVEVKEEKP
jgi:beta-lactamase regulating signal transducer with metallopeptidase domain